MQGSITEDSKDKKPDKLEKQKEQEIVAIQRSIVQYHLSKFCKANAVALAVIFKALIRGEGIYPKARFLQDLSAERLLSHKEKESQQTTNQENPPNNIQKNRETFKNSSKTESQDNATISKDSAIITTQSKIQESDKKESQENISQDSTSNAQSKGKPSSSFPLNIEG